MRYMCSFLTLQDEWHALENPKQMGSDITAGRHIGNTDTECVCECVKGSNVVERFYGHITENTSRLGYKHVCVNYLHLACHDYQY